jgi:hypothetical protein
MFFGRRFLTRVISESKIAPGDRNAGRDSRSAETISLDYFGRTTASMMWIALVAATLSVLTIVALSIMAAPPWMVAVKGWPCTDFTAPGLNCAAITWAGAMW